MDSCSLTYRWKRGHIFWKTVWNDWVAIWWIDCNDMLSRFYTVLECDGRTDRRTDRIAISVQKSCWVPCVTVKTLITEEWFLPLNCPDKCVMKLCQKLTCLCVSDDYLRMYAPKCGGCGKPIMSSFITAVRQNWHLDCFVCFVSIGYLRILCLLLILNNDDKQYGHNVTVSVNFIPFCQCYFLCFCEYIVYTFFLLLSRRGNSLLSALFEVFEDKL